jgi:hypothetical protein
MVLSLLFSESKFQATERLYVYMSNRASIGHLEQTAVTEAGKSLWQRNINGR